MKISIVFSVFLIILTASNLNSVLGLDENAVKEFGCIFPGIDTSLNWKWVYKIEKWYVPLLSKLELYRMAEDLLGEKISDISEDEIVNPCLISNKEFTAWGFNQTGLKYITQLDDDFVLHFQSVDEGMKGKYYMALTDNENFIVGITCWDDNQASWSVMSTKPTINHDLKDVLLDYIKSHGFNMDLFFEDKYENCELQNVGKIRPPIIKKSEL